MFRLLIVALVTLNFQYGLANDTESLLIEKLSRVYLNLPDSNPGKIKVTLRLADLHSEKARKLAMKSFDPKCKECADVDKDRKMAVNYYKEALRLIQGDEKARVMIQMGHLNELMGRSDEAIILYREIPKITESKSLQTEADFALGELYFKRSFFQEALTFYNRVYYGDQKGKRGLAAFRKAWCHFNSGEVDRAINTVRKILTTPELLSREGGQNINIDNNFKEEVSKDFVNFIVRKGQIGTEQVVEVFKLSPETTRLSNVQYLAKELERLGQLGAAIEAWSFYGERTEKPIDRLESFAFKSQLQLQNNSKKDAKESFSMATRIWKTIGNCTDERCKGLQVYLKNFVVDWNRLEKKLPSPELLEVYGMYNETFHEPEMVFWSAQVHKMAKRGEEAFRIYGEYIAKSKDTEKLEKALLDQIEIAETLKNTEFKKRAYSNYLKISKKKERLLEVKYQLAFLEYESGNNEVAANQLREIAGQVSGDQKVRLQAAELSLDALAQLKDDVRIEKWALSYKELFPKLSNRWDALVRKSIFNQSQKYASEKVGNLNESWNVLGRFNTKGASEEEKLNYYRNKLVLAKDLKKIPEAIESADILLAMKGIDQKDYEFALKTRIWLAELVLDFSTALKLAKGKKEKLNHFQLAQYSDLAGKNSTIHYLNYVNANKEAEDALPICAKLAREYLTQLVKIKECLPILKKDPKVYSQIELERYGLEKDDKIARAIVNDSRFNETPQALILSRHLDFKILSNDLSTFQKSKIRTNSMNRMTRDLKRKVAGLNTLESKFAKIIQKGDWSTQVVALSMLQKENENLFNVILELPIPKGLSQEEMAEYRRLLEEQALPFKTRSEEIKIKLASLWSQQDSVTSITKGPAGGSQAHWELWSTEVNHIKPYLPEGALFEFASWEPTVRTVEASKIEVERNAMIRAQVRQNPFSINNIKALMKSEETMGNQAMVQYLKARLETLGSDSKEVIR